MQTVLGAAMHGWVQALVKIAHLISYEHMGQMRVDCIANCSCNSTLIDSHFTKVCAMGQGRRRGAEGGGHRPAL